LLDQKINIKDSATFWFEAWKAKVDLLLRIILVLSLSGWSWLDESHDPYTHPVASWNSN